MSTLRPLFLLFAMSGFALPACSSDSSPSRPQAGGDNQGGGAGNAATGGAGGGTGGASGMGGTSANGGNANGGGAGTAGASAGTGGTPSDASVGRETSTPTEAGAVPVLADNFESATANGPPDPGKWSVDLNGGGTVTIDGTMGHSSSKSLHVNGMGGFHTMAMAKGAPLFPAPGNRFFGRVYLRLAAAQPTGHVIWIEAGSVTNDVAETRIGSNIGQLDINRFPGDTEQRAPAGKIGAGEWHCFEFMFDGGGNDARVWLDSTELTDLHVTNWVAPNQANGNNTSPILNWAPSYDAVRLGWELSGAEVWFDDVAFGYDRLGCL
ncbi:MAG TPA: hypothetical protein VGL13_03880 [Polyangiaceae bacterium]